MASSPDSSPAVTTKASPAGEDWVEPGKQKPGESTKNYYDRMIKEAQAARKEHKRREDIRSTLLADARKDYIDLATREETQYSRDLAKMEEKTNKKLEGSKFSKSVVVLDPFKFDVGMALGIPAEEIVRRNVAASANPDETAFGTIEGAAGDMNGAASTKFGTPSYTQNPVAYSIHNNPEPKVCVIVPEAADSTYIGVKEFSRGENQRFINDHEAWHCRDDKYTAQLGKIDWASVSSVNYSDDISKLPDNKDARDYYSLLHKKECIADVGSLGDMIREGRDPKILDNVVRWRNHSAWEVKHFTTPVLEGFKKKIEEMGVENFRKLDDKQAQKLYYEVVDKYALDGEDIRKLNDYEAGGVARKAFYKAASVIDGDLDRAMQFRARQQSEMAKAAAEDALPNPPANSYSPNAPLPPAAGKAKTILVQWDASKALKDKAFATDHKITPATMIRAYGDMQDELCAKTRSDPANTVLYEEQMTRLKVALGKDLQGMDYVAENKKRGVTLENVEPSLKKYAKPAPKAVASAAAPKAPL